MPLTLLTRAALDDTVPTSAALYDMDVTHYSIEELLMLLGLDVEEASEEDMLEACAAARVRLRGARDGELFIRFIRDLQIRLRENAD